MIEFLSISASLIAIASAILAFRKWLSPRKAGEDEAFRKALSNLESYFAQWRDVDYPAKHIHLIDFEHFNAIGRHKARILSESEEDQRVFLLVCAVKNGVWGEWWPEGAAPGKIISSLATLLNGQAGWRPVWRAAYLLERLSSTEGLDWIEHLPERLTSDRNVQEALAVIKERRVIPYLEAISQGNNSHLRDKAFTILEKIRAYDGLEVRLQYPHPDKT